MAVTPNLWLIGVRKDELDCADKPRFLSQLQGRFRGRDLKREGRPILIRTVVDPEQVRRLQKQHGWEYVQFFYVDEPLIKAAKKEGIKLHPSHLVFGAPEGRRRVYEHQPAG